MSDIREPTKECTVCGQEKPLSGFNKDKNRRLGVESRCKVCYKRYYQKNKDKISEQHKRYHQENRDKTLERKKQYYQENKDKISERKKQWNQNLPSMIYEIHNTITKQVYVGQTSQGRKRWSSHKSDLRRRTHDNPHLQKAWDKWGADAFRFAVVEELPANCSKELLLEKETALISEHESNGVPLYNVYIGR